MLNIIFIAYEFPPLINGGSFRPYYFSKYLKDFGINPIIITLHPDDYKIFWPNAIIDEQLENEFTTLTISGNFNNKSYHKCKNQNFNPYLGGLELDTWYPNVKKEIPSIIARYAPKAIVATGPPFSILEIGRRIAKKYRVPFVADLRDAWSQWCYTPYNSRMHYIRTLIAERRVLNGAQAIIITSEQTKSDLIRIHKTIIPNKFHVITNGYPHKIIFQNEISLDKTDAKIKIGYVGSFYFYPCFHEMIFNPWYKKIKIGFKQPFIFQYVPHKENWHYRTPFYFFKALALLINQFPEIKDSIEVVFAGKKTEWFDNMVKNFKLENIVNHIGPISHNESMTFQKSCDLLLLTSAKVIGGKDYSIAGKTYEYFSMQKPILGFVTNSAQKDIIEKSGMGIICDPDSTEASAQKLKKIITEGFNLNLNVPFLEQFWRKPLTKKFAAVVKKEIEIYK